MSSEIFELRKYFVFIFFEISFFFILFISRHYLALTLTRFWHYLTLTLLRSWHCLTLAFSDTDIDWVLTFLSWENILFSFFLRFHYFEISFFWILFISWHYLTLTWTRFWHYLTLTLTGSLHCLDTDIVWHWHWLSSEKILVSFFLILFFIWKRIKETHKILNKRIYCSLSKEWLIHQQLLSYCKATSKIDKNIDFKEIWFLILKNACSTLQVGFLPNNTW